MKEMYYECRQNLKTKTELKESFSDISSESFCRLVEIKTDVMTNLYKKVVCLQMISTPKK